MTGSKGRLTKSGKSSKLPPAAPQAASERGLKIGQAARLLGVETYVLRFWESQFSILKPRHARSKHRFYQPRDLEVLKLIKRLLHKEGFTIAGANKYIRENGTEPPKLPKPAAASEKQLAEPIGGQVRQTLAEVRRDLESIHKLLAS